MLEQDEMLRATGTHNPHYGGYHEEVQNNETITLLRIAQSVIVVALYRPKKEGDDDDECGRQTMRYGSGRVLFDRRAITGFFAGGKIRFFPSLFTGKVTNVRIN